MEIETQLGLHFVPSNLGPRNYPETAKYWLAHKDLFNRTTENPDKDKIIRLVIEAGFHTIQEFEHNSPDSPQGKTDLEVAILTVEELVWLVANNYS